MCIIAIKPTNVDMMSDDIIETMFFNNPDGAGFMFNYNGSVEIHKGYMTCKDLLQALKRIDKRVNLKDKTVILHFRIGTHGGNVASNTHPFPISANLAALQKTTAFVPLAVAHNGIIPITTRDKKISDTMEFILTVLAPLRKIKRDFYKNPDAHELIYNIAFSKFAFLDSDGNYSTIGEFNTVDNILYSNYSYRTYVNYNTRDYWDKYSVVDDAAPLMWLTDDDGYIRLAESGALIGCEDYLIDSSGTLYEYDYDMDCAIPSDDTAYNHNGNRIKYDDERATYCYIGGMYDIKSI